MTIQRMGDNKEQSGGSADIPGEVPNARIRGVTQWTWPPLWQPGAIDAVRPYVGADVRLEILVDDPATAVHGTLIAGYVQPADDGSLKIIHDHSGRADAYPWPLLRGPVLRVSVLRPRRRRLDVYTHPDWKAPPTTR